MMYLASLLKFRLKVAETCLGYEKTSPETIAFIFVASNTFGNTGNNKNNTSQILVFLKFSKIHFFCLLFWGLYRDTKWSTFVENPQNGSNTWFYPSKFSSKSIRHICPIWKKNVATAKNFFFEKHPKFKKQQNCCHSNSFLYWANVLCGLTIKFRTIKSLVWAILRVFNKCWPLSVPCQASKKAGKKSNFLKFSKMKIFEVLFLLFILLLVL